MLSSEVDLVINRTFVQLDFRNVSILLSPRKLLPFQSLSRRGHRIGPFGARLGESLPLGLKPVLIEPSLAFLSNMLVPDILDSSHSDSFHNFLLVVLESQDDPFYEQCVPC